jgi:hypothetical protein
MMPADRHTILGSARPRRAAPAAGNRATARTHAPAHLSAHAAPVSEDARVSEYEESAGQDQNVPGATSAEPDPEPPRSRQVGASRAAAAVAGAVTSRTAGWMVAAALAGSLVTLAVDHGASQPTAGQITIRNAGRVSAAPPGRSTHRQIQASPLTPGALPQAQGGMAWVMQPACAVPGPGGPPIAKRPQRMVTIPVPKRIVIGRQGHRNLQIYAGQLPASKRIRLVRPACPMFPLRCHPGMRIGIRQVPASARVQIGRRGRFFVTGPSQQPPGRIPVRVPAAVIVPSPRIAGSPGPQCMAFWPRLR